MAIILKVYVSAFDTHPPDLFATAVSNSFSWMPVVANSKAFAPLTTMHFFSDSIFNQISFFYFCKFWYIWKKESTL